MKQSSIERSLIFILFLYAAAGCKKTVEQSNTPDTIRVTHDSIFTAPIIPYPITPLQECNNAPYYGDSIVFSQPAKTTDYYIYPQTNQNLSGTYLAWPQGLVMDSKTGAIDLTKSETGQRYSIGFVKSGTTDTCVSQLIVAGVSYMDSIYVLNHSDTTSRPYFNANPYGSSPCNGSGGPGSGCQFDYNDYAKKQGIIIDKKSGFIDLKKTTKNLNFAMLWNGASLTTRIYYKLNDQSNNASQMIEVKLIYYAHKSDVPPNISAQITQNLFYTLNDALISRGPSARPPLIVIVREG